MTTRELVWRLLDERGPLTSGAVASLLDLTTKVASDACGKLRERGLAVRDGAGKYEAIGEFVPDPRKEAKSDYPLPPCALAECWGWMPTERTIA